MNEFSDTLSSDINIIKNFWNKQIWKIDIKLITNKKILEIFLQLNKYYTKLEEEENNVLFNIDNNYEVFIINNKKIIKKKINKFKKDKLIFLKTHADLFYEYYIIISKYLENINFNWITKSINPNNNLNNNLDYNIESHFEYFSNNINNTDDNKKILLLNLHNNLEKYKIDLINFINKYKDNNKQFLIIDVENLLKSFKIQNYLKSILKEDEYLNYFNTWLNGEFKEESDIDFSNDLSMSQYSSKSQYIEPFTSLNLNIQIKLILIKIIITNLLFNYNTINILNIKKTTNENNHNYNSKLNNMTETENNLDNHHFISILHSKNNIREQDDHILLFIYTLLKKNNFDTILLSNDKFKWYSNISIQNFKYLYDFDNHTKELVIDESYTPDIYKLENKYYFFPLVNFPIILDKYLKNIVLSSNDFYINKKKIKNNIIDLFNINYDNIYNYLIYYSVQEKITNISNNNLFDLINLINNFSNEIKTNFYKIFTFLDSNTKKDIFKLSIKFKQNFFDQNQINYYIYIIDKYKILIELFQIIKVIGIKFYPYDKNYINLCTLLFSNIIQIYDNIDDNLYKIRKLVNSKSNIKLLFKNIYLTLIYVKKQGFFTKNIFIIK